MASFVQQHATRFFQKNILQIFLNTDCIGTEAIDVLYEQTGV